MTLCRHHSFWISLTGFLLSLTLGNGGAEELLFKGSASLKQEFNDNLFLQSRDPQSDFITTISLGSEFINRSERLDMRLSGRSDLLLYARNTDLDSLNHTYRGTFYYRLSPRATVSVEAGYLRDTTPDRDVQTTGLLLGTVSRQRFTGALLGQYLLSDKLTAVGSYSFEHELFSGPGASDSLVHSVGWGFTRDLADWISRTKGRMNFGFAHYQFETSMVENFFLTMGASYDVNERISLSADAGFRYTISSFEVLELTPIPPPLFFRWTKREEERTGLGGVMRATLSYRWERTGASLGIQHDLMTASGRGVPVERTGATFSLEHRFAENLSLSISTWFFLNRAKAETFGTRDIDEQALTIRPQVGWELSSNLLLEAFYTHTHLWDKRIKTAASRNLVSLMLTFRKDLWSK